MGATQPSSAPSAGPGGRRTSTRVAPAASSSRSTSACRPFDRQARRPEARPRPESRGRYARGNHLGHHDRHGASMDLEFLTQALFAVGTIVLAFAFAAAVGHAVLLANGRRALAAAGAAAEALAAGPVKPAWAGVATGSFVQTRAAVAAAGPTDYAAPSPLSSASRWLTFGAFAILFASIAVRAWIVGRGPWGNLFEFSAAFATSILFGYLVLARRYPIASIAFIPVGVALGLALYASSLPHEINPLVPALQNPPLLTIHVGLAVVSYGIFATSFAAGVGYLIQG